MTSTSESNDPHALFSGSGQSPTAHGVLA